MTNLTTPRMLRPATAIGYQANGSQNRPRSNQNQELSPITLMLEIRNGDLCLGQLLPGDQTSTSVQAGVHQRHDVAVLTPRTWTPGPT